MSTKIVENSNIEENPQTNSKKGFTCGAFDLLHAGHALMLKECRDHCDYLIIGLQKDPNIDRPKKNKPVQTYEERDIMIKSIKWVDEVVYYNTEDDLLKLLQALDIDIRIIGADWEGKKFTGWQLDIPVVFNSRDHGYSTSDLRERVYQAESEKRK